MVRVKERHKKFYFPAPNKNHSRQIAQQMAHYFSYDPAYLPVRKGLTQNRFLYQRLRHLNCLHVSRKCPTMPELWHTVALNLKKQQEKKKEGVFMAGYFKKFIKENYKLSYAKAVPGLMVLC